MPTKNNYQILKRIMQTKLTETQNMSAKELEVYINENGLFSRNIDYIQLAHILGRAFNRDGETRMFAKNDDGKWRLNK